jgi:hypothetical protein
LIRPNGLSIRLAGLGLRSTWLGSKNGMLLQTVVVLHQLDVGQFGKGSSPRRRELRHGGVHKIELLDQVAADRPNGVVLCHIVHAVAEDHYLPYRSIGAGGRGTEHGQYQD